MKTKTTALFSLLLAVTVAGIARASGDHRAPEVPESLRVPAGYRVSLHAYAVGVQIYTATPSSTDPMALVWTFTAPEAVLLDADGAFIGTHFAYAGPTRPAWQSESGGMVVGTRTVPPVTVDPDSIPWLLLDAVQAEGPGILKRTCFIQRVNTTGGLAPAFPPTQAGQEARVPYTAEYFFFRDQDDLPPRWDRARLVLDRPAHRDLGGRHVACGLPRRMPPRATNAERSEGVRKR